MEFTKEDVKKRIIIRLVRWRKWGGSHTENIIGGMPSDEILKFYEQRCGD